MPKLFDFGTLPPSWTVQQLFSLTPADRPIVYGIVQAGPHWPGGIPYIRSTDVGGNIDVATLPRTSPNIARKYRRAEVRPGDLVYSLRGNIGEMSIVPDSLPIANLTQGTARISTNGTVSTHFVRYALSSPLLASSIEAVAKGSTFREISIDQLRKVPIPVPPQEEQQAIVSILLTWDRGLQQLTELIATKVRFKRGLMQQLLTGKRRFSEFKTTGFVESHVGDVLQETFRPVVWNDNELYQLASIRRHSGGLFWREALFGRQIKVKRLHNLQEADFLISHIQAAYGAMGLVPAEFVGGRVSEMYTILTPKDPGRIDMRYLGYLSEMKRMRHQAYLACNGFFAERLRLNFDPSEFMKQKILLPESREEQAKIADLLDSLVQEVKVLQDQLDRLRKQERSLMQKLITGALRVRLPNSEGPEKGGA